jgi:hypothetical protein
MDTVTEQDGQIPTQRQKQKKQQEKETRTIKRGRREVEEDRGNEVATKEAIRWRHRRTEGGHDPREKSLTKELSHSLQGSLKAPTPWKEWVRSASTD